MYIKFQFLDVFFSLASCYCLQSFIIKKNVYFFHKAIGWPVIVSIHSIWSLVDIGLIGIVIISPYFFLHIILILVCIILQSWFIFLGTKQLHTIYKFMIFPTADCCNTSRMWFLGRYKRLFSYKYQSHAFNKTPS